MMLAGFYEREITPKLGSHMPGGFRFNGAKGVKERLMVKGVVFELNNKRAVLLSADSLFIPQPTYDKAIQKIYDYTGITEKDILIQATHSHTAGPLSNSFGGDGMDEEYIDWLGEMIADCAIVAFQRMIPVTAKIGKCNIDGITFVRNYVMKDGRIRTNPPANHPDVVEPFGKVDTEFQTIFFYNENGEAVGSVMNFACHHCCVGGNELCADYSAVLAKEMKLRFGIDYVNVFLSGTSGNLNHIDFTTADQWRIGKTTPRYVQMGKVLAEAAFKMYDEAVELKLDVLNASKEGVVVKKREIPKELLDEVTELYESGEWLKETNIGDICNPETRAYKCSIAGSLINISKEPDEYTAMVQAIRLGDCMIYALSGEVYAEFGLDIKKRSPGKYAFVASIANGGLYCYIPTKESFGTTIYEAQITSAKAEPATGYKMADKAIELAKKLM